MHESSYAERVLSLLTRPDRAAAITGDLLEESRIHRPGWLTLQVIRTIPFLAVETILSSPIRASIALIIGFVLYIAGGIVTSTEFRSIVSSRATFEVFGWHPVFAYWWKSFFVWLFWGRILYPFLFGLAFARVSRGKEVAMCIALAALLESFRVWLIVTGHLQLRKGSHDFAFLSLCSLVAAGVFARHRSTPILE